MILNIKSNLSGSLLVKLKRQFDLSYFVETGTSHGATAELAAIVFDKVWTIELDPACLAVALQKLSPYPHVTALCGPSADVLRTILPHLDRPTMFWLDAHWSGGPLKPIKECPLLDELCVLADLRVPAVIVVDDARMFVNPPGPPHDPTHWPSVEAIKDASSSGWHFRQVDDVFVLTPTSFTP